MRQLIKDVLLGFMLFLVLGPIVGGAALALGFIATAASTLRLDSAIFAINFSPNFILLPHFVAAIPAAIVGVLAGIARPHLAQRSSKLLMGFLSSTISMAYVYFISRKLPGSMEFFSIACPSFIAGVVLSWIFQPRDIKIVAPRSSTSA